MAEDPKCEDRLSALQSKDDARLSIIHLLSEYPEFVKLQPAPSITIETKPYEEQYARTRWGGIQSKWGQEQFLLYLGERKKRKSSIYIVNIIYTEDSRTGSVPSVVPLFQRFVKSLHLWKNPSSHKGSKTLDRDVIWYVMATPTSTKFVIFHVDSQCRRRPSKNKHSGPTRAYIHLKNPSV